MVTLVSSRPKLRARPVLNFLGSPNGFKMQNVYLSRLMRVWVGLIMLVALFGSRPHLSKPEYILTTMNEELLAASVLFIKKSALLVSHNSFINFFAIVQC
jgi:hypothetical protein